MVPLKKIPLEWRGLVEDMPQPGKGQDPRLTALDRARTQSMFGLVKSLKKNAQQLVEFIDSNRDAARLAGIEGISIEVGTILEGGRFDRVYDALKEAEEDGSTVDLTEDGLGKVQRLEKLLAEASGSIVKFTGHSSPIEISGSRRDMLSQASQASQPSGETKKDEFFWFPIVVVGTLALVVTILVLKKD